MSKSESKSFDNHPLSVWIVRDENEGKTIGVYTTIDLAFEGLMTVDMSDEDLLLTKKVCSNGRYNKELVKLVEMGYSIENIKINQTQ